MTAYELIMCIVNTGFSDTVMAAAKDKGARGGTVVHARGTANKEAEEFFHITIQPDKEIVMILVPSEIRDDVLHAVYQAAGLKTAGQGISFSLPVTHAVGLTAASSEVAATVNQDTKSEEQSVEAVQSEESAESDESTEHDETDEAKE